MTSKLPESGTQSGPKPSNTALKLVLAAIAMFGFGFALVPLYDVFCEFAGINGKTAGQVEKVEQWVDTSRTIKVQFITTNNDGMPWEFETLQEEVEGISSNLDIDLSTKEGLQKLVDNLKANGRTQKEVMNLTGKSRSTIKSL